MTNLASELPDRVAPRVDREAAGRYSATQQDAVMGVEQDEIVSPPEPGELSHRDRALLRAVAAGHGEVTDDCGPVLTIDGRCCCDQLAVQRLVTAGLIERPSGAEPRPALLTPIGHMLLLLF